MLDQEIFRTGPEMLRFVCLSLYHYFGPQREGQEFHESRRSSIIVPPFPGFGRTSDDPGMGRGSLLLTELSPISDARRPSHRPVQCQGQVRVGLFRFQENKGGCGCWSTDRTKTLIIFCGNWSQRPNDWKSYLHCAILRLNNVIRTRIIDFASQSSSSCDVYVVSASSMTGLARRLVSDPYLSLCIGVNSSSMGLRRDRI